MKKCFPMLAFCLFLLSCSSVRAETVNNIEGIQLRDEVILNLLFPSIFKEVEKYYGEPKQFHCERILHIEKKVVHETYHYYNVTVELMTFEDAHNPPYDLVTIKFSNRNSNEWQAVDINSKGLKPMEFDKCQH